MAKVKKTIDYLRDKFSFSKLSTYSQCPRKAFMRYVMRKRMESAEFLLFGRGVHAGQEEDNRAKLRGENMTQGQVLDVAVAEYESEDGGNVDRFVDQHTQQLETYFTPDKEGKVLRDFVRPVKDTVEMPFEFTVGVTPDPDSEPKRPAIVEGFIDTVSQDEVTGRKTIVDYKAVGRKKTDADAAKSIQLTMYQVGADAEDGAFMNFVKTKKQNACTSMTKPAELTQSRMQRMLTFLSDCIAGFRGSLKSGDWPKCSPDCFWCSETACEFHDYCYPSKDPKLVEFISLEEVRKVGTVEVPEWRKSNLAKKKDPGGEATGKTS